jgi:MFS superfamily sulfate permease-like transporter
VRNRFDRMEWAGAFGDFGTLVPFVAGYIGVLKMDPFGILFALGAAMVVSGVYRRTPFPVQPMKALGAVAITQAAQTAVITPAAVCAASLTTGLIWLVLGLTGSAGRIASLVPRPVVVAIVLGLGMSFMVEGIRMMATEWLPATIGLAVTVLLLTSRRIPAMLLLLAFGVICGVLMNPGLLDELAAVSPGIRAPALSWLSVTWNDFVIGFVFLTLPQLPLTLGNAIIAIREENNRLFADRPVSEKGVAVSTGLMNLAGSAVGGIPMCHGAGGMAGHVAFGARTGGAVIICGALLLVLAVFFSDSVGTLFGLFPPAILGVILFLAGAQLALGSCDFSNDKRERFVTLAAAAFAMWNVGLAFVIGMAGIYLVRRGWLKL